MKTALLFVAPFLLAGVVHAEEPKKAQQQINAAQKPPRAGVSPSVANVPGSGGQSPESGVMGSMMELQKDASKEARADQKLSKQQKQAELNAKESKLNEQNKQIGAGKDEAKQKADHARGSATSQLVTGTASGTNAAAAASPTPSAPVRKPIQVQPR